MFSALRNFWLQTISLIMINLPHFGDSGTYILQLCLGISSAQKGNAVLFVSAIPIDAFGISQFLAYKALWEQPTKQQ